MTVLKQIKDLPASSGSARTDLMMTQDISNNSRKTTMDQMALSVRGQNTFLIESMSDFPAAVAGVITLTSGVYHINAALTTTDRFEVDTSASVRLVGGVFSIHGIVYTGSGNMFSGSGFGTLDFDNLFLSCPNGTLFDIQPASPSATSLYLIDSGIVDCSSLGTIKNLTTFSTEFCAFQDIGTGLVMDSIGSSGMLNSQSTSWKNQSTAMFTVQGAWGTCVFNAFLFLPGSNETVFDIKSTSTIRTGSVVSCPVDLSNNGSVFASGSKDQTDIYWTFKSNSNIPDSMAETQLSLTDNLTATAVGTVDTPTLIAGSWVDSAERFTTTASGRAKYIGLEAITLSLSANPTAVLDTGTNKDVSFYFVHGNETDHAITAFADGGGGQVVVTSASHGLSNGDRVVIRNTTNYNGVFTISNVTTDTYEITDTWVANDATGDWSIIIEQSKAQNQLASTTKASNTSVFSGFQFSTNDFIELFVENNTDGTSILVTNCNLLIN